jgi:hypothetical protein
MSGWRVEECHRFDPDTELKGGSPVERRLKEGDRGGHVMKKSRGVTDEGKKEDYIGLKGSDVYY